MIIDGQEVNYKDWCADDALREATANGMDAYFREVSGGEEINIPEGTPVRGYRFMYRTNKGELWSPFFNNTLQEASAYLNIPAEDDKSALFIQDRVGSNIDKDGVNVDPTGRGFYYWPDRGMAEDYMKIAIAHMKHEQHRPSDFVLKHAITRERDYSFSERISHLISNKKHDWLPKHVEDTETWIQAPRAQDDGDKEWFKTHMKVSTREQGKWKITETAEYLEFPLGEYVLLPVEGIAVRNDNNDAGFTMNGLKVVGEPLLSIPLTEPYDSLHS